MLVIDFFAVSCFESLLICAEGDTGRLRNVAICARSASPSCDKKHLAGALLTTLVAPGLVFVPLGFLKEFQYGFKPIIFASATPITFFLAKSAVLTS